MPHQLMTFNHLPMALLFIAIAIGICYIVPRLFNQVCETSLYLNKRDLRTIVPISHDEYRLTVNRDGIHWHIKMVYIPIYEEAIVLHERKVSNLSEGLRSAFEVMDYHIDEYIRTGEQVGSVYCGYMSSTRNAMVEFALKIIE